MNTAVTEDHISSVMGIMGTTFKGRLEVGVGMSVVAVWAKDDAGRGKCTKQKPCKGLRYSKSVRRAVRVAASGTFSLHG